MSEKTKVSEAEAAQQVAVFDAPRLPYAELITERFPQFVPDRSSWKTLVEAVFPNAKTPGGVVLALSYCKSRNLDPFKKPVHIVPMWSSSLGRTIETVWPGISELRTTAFRTGEYAGCDAAEFGPMIEKTFDGMVEQWVDRKRTNVKVTKTVKFPEWCRITVYRKIQGTICKFVGPKVTWLEDYATMGNSDVPNEMWASRAEGQLEKCAEAAALRRAFPEEIGGQISAEEMEGKSVYHDAAQAARDVTPTPPAPPPPPSPPPAQNQAAPTTPPAPDPKPTPPEPTVETPKAEPEIIPPDSKETPRGKRQKKAADDAKADADKTAAEPSVDPEDFLKFVEETLAAVDKAEDLEGVFNGTVEPRMSPNMFPPDREEAYAIYSRHEKRLGID